MQIEEEQRETGGRQQGDRRGREREGGGKGFGSERDRKRERARARERRDRLDADAEADGIITSPRRRPRLRAQLHIANGQHFLPAL